MSSMMMNNISNATAKEAEQVLAAWNRIHDDDRRNKLYNLTRVELVQLASKLGLDSKHASIYGNTTYKNTWINAIQIAYDTISRAPDKDVVLLSEMDYDDEFDSTNLVSAKKEREALKKEREDIQKERAEFEKAQEEALNAAQEAWANLEKARAELGESTIDERTAFAQKTKEHGHAVKALSRRENDLKRREDELKTQTEAFHQDTTAREKKLKQHFEQIQRMKAASTKRKRENADLKKENDEYKSRKRRLEHDVAVALKRFNGEACWSYACPSAFSGANAALWRKYKCKQRVPGSVYSSDRLRHNGQAPKWKSLTEVEQALTKTLLLASTPGQ